MNLLVWIALDVFLVALGVFIGVKWAMWAVCKRLADLGELEVLKKL
jgi:hypothetical protein